MVLTPTCKKQSVLFSFVSIHISCVQTPFYDIFTHAIQCIYGDSFYGDGDDDGVWKFLFKNDNEL